MQAISNTALSTSPEEPPRSANESAFTNETAIDFQNFLTLLTTQLRNQDPLSPLESTEFVAQLASFSSVEQLVNVNKRLDDIAASITNDAIDRYAPLIGRVAEISGGVAHFKGEPIRFRASGEPGATHAEGVIKNKAGAEVARLKIKNSGYIQSWDGIVSKSLLPEGAYHVAIEYYDGDEVLRSELANVFDKIVEVRLSGDSAEFHLKRGGAAFPDQIVGIGEDFEAQ